MVEPVPQVALTARDTRLVYASNFTRGVGFGFIAVLLGLYLSTFGFNGTQIGLYLSVAAASAAGLNFALSSRSDRIGRRRVLILSGALMAACGIVLGLAPTGPVLFIAAVLGSLPPSGNGLPLAIEQSILAGHALEKRPSIYATYGVMAAGATAIGTLAAGLPSWLNAAGLSLPMAYRAMMLLYACAGLAMVIVALRLGPEVEAKSSGDQRAQGTPTLAPSAQRRPRLGLTHSQRPVLAMAGIMVADTFSGQLLTTALLAYWLHVRFGLGPSSLALLFFGIQTLTAASYPLTVPIARRIGLINTAAWTNIVANVLLAACVFTPSITLVVVFLLLRGFLVDMDIPTRQAYLVSIVEPSERTTAAGTVALGQQVGFLAGPAVGGYTLVVSTTVPFVLTGAIKTLVNVALWLTFRHIDPKG